MEPISQTFTSFGVAVLKRKLMQRSATEPKLPSWYVNAEPAAYSDACRAKCDHCFGRGTPFALETRYCQPCQEQEMACPRHLCLACGGSGFVCPRCRGVRRILSHRWESGAPMPEILPCPACCATGGDGKPAVVSRQGEYREVQAYLGRHKEFRPLTIEELRADRAERSRQQREEARAYHAQWLAAQPGGAVRGRRDLMERAEVLDQRAANVRSGSGDPLIPADVAVELEYIRIMRRGGIAR